eukprot:328550-Amphidinium_carterae.1
MDRSVCNGIFPRSSTSCVKDGFVCGLTTEEVARAVPLAREMLFAYALAKQLTVLLLHPSVVHWGSIGEALNLPVADVELTLAAVEC